MEKKANIMETQKKIQDAQEYLLDAVLEFLKNNPKEFFGSKKISDKLGLIEGHKYYFGHCLLTELKKRGKIEQSDNRRGFRYKEQIT